MDLTSELVRNPITLLIEGFFVLSLGGFLVVALINNVKKRLPYNKDKGAQMAQKLRDIAEGANRKNH